MPVWSTKPQGDPASVGHRMDDDGYGRPSIRVRGRSSEGLIFRRDISWERVPADQRCAPCEQSHASAVARQYRAP